MEGGAEWETVGEQCKREGDGGLGLGVEGSKEAVAMRGGLRAGVCICSSQMPATEKRSSRLGLGSSVVPAPSQHPGILEQLRTPHPHSP